MRRGKCDLRSTGLGDHETGGQMCMVQVVGADRRQVVCLFAVIQMKDAGLAPSGHVPTRVGILGVVLDWHVIDRGRKLKYFRTLIPS